jgi:dihydroorotate dehydrogenase (NAD+) catalytic subunit
MMRVKIGGIEFKNPVIAASGTFGYGLEYKELVDIEGLGGFVTKSITLKGREGNGYPRGVETEGGMLNAVGLQNEGVEHFIKEIWTKIKDCETEIIVSIAGSSVEEYTECARQIGEVKGIKGIEVNISCPNVKEGGMQFGRDVKMTEGVVKAIREVYKKTMIVKLSPNVTDITEIARAAEGGGADALTAINTVLGMAVDIRSQKPKLSTVTGGLSGPCIKPIALRCVWEVYNAVKIPVIGVGGIKDWQDVVEFMLAGASAVQVGMYNFAMPTVTTDIASDLEMYFTQKRIESVSELIGAMKMF